MFELAQISDLHIAERPLLSELAGKRALGFINWQRKRKYVHRREVLEALTRDLKERTFDHIAVTGDLVNLSLPAEYTTARGWLDRLGPSSDVTVIPGNHDVYVPRVLAAAAEYWGDFMHGDDASGRGVFPFQRRRGDVVLIALSSGVPTGPFLATGTLGERQLSLLADMLERNDGLFRIVLIHHPPSTPPRRRLRRLTDGEDFRRVLAGKGAELVLHGHDHVCSIVSVDGPHGPIPVVGAPSASAASAHGDEDAAGYNIFRVEGAAGDWRCELIARQRDAEGKFRDVKRVALR